MNNAEEGVEVGSGNIFADLGFDPHEAAELAARSACIRRIARIKEQRGWNQAQLGDAIGMRQSEVSQLLRGKVSRFSLEGLLHALGSSLSLGAGANRQSNHRDRCSQWPEPR
jgi:predicted XRE-type DNA-binding protein